MLELTKAGNQALDDLVQGEGLETRNRVRRVRQFFQALARRMPADQVQILTVVSPFPLPVECMPLFELPQFRLEPGSKFTPGDVLREAGTAFVGLRMACRQVADGGPIVGGASAVPESEVLRAEFDGGDATVAVATYWNRRLKGIDAEVRRIGTVRPFKLSERQPDRELMSREDREDVLARMLVRGGAGFRAPIVYVTAHADTSAESSANHALLFGTQQYLPGNDLAVRVKDLSFQADSVKLELLHGGPLSIVAACGAADISYSQPASIPRALRGCGHRAVVAPMLTVDTDAAREFALALLTRLGAGDTLGEALVQTRRCLPSGRINVASMLFSCFGEALLRVDPAAVVAPAAEFL